jgi:hypothetical protein
LANLNAAAPEVNPRPGQGNCLADSQAGMRKYFDEQPPLAGCLGEQIAQLVLG